MLRNTHIMRMNRVTDVANAKRDGPIDYGLRSKRGISCQASAKQPFSCFGWRLNVNTLRLLEAVRSREEIGSKIIMII